MRIMRELGRLETRLVEFLTATLSLWFAIVLLTSEASYRPVPAWAWSAWCLTAAMLKLLGVGASFEPIPPLWSRYARLAGSILGAIFWTILATVLFILLRGGLSWGGYGVIALAQSWCVVRVWRDR